MRSYRRRRMALPTRKKPNWSTLKVDKLYLSSFTVLLGLGGADGNEQKKAANSPDEKKVFPEPPKHDVKRMGILLNSLLKGIYGIEQAQQVLSTKKKEED